MVSLILCPEAGRRGPKSTGIGTRLSLQPSSRLPAAPDSPGFMPCRAKRCHAVPCLAPRQAVPPLHTEFQGRMATRQGRRGGEEGGKEDREGFYSCSPRRSGESLVFPLFAHDQADPAVWKGVGDMPRSWWPLMKSVSASHVLRMAVGASQGQVDSNSLPATLRSQEE